MTTSSIVRSLFSLLLFIPLPSPAEAIDEKTNFAESHSQIETICSKASDNTQKCNVYATSKTGRQHLLSFPFPPASIDYQNSIFIMTFPCGVSCSATYFYRPNTKLGGPLPLVVAYDAEREIALSIVSPKKLQMFRFFDGNGKAKFIGEIDLKFNRDSDIRESLVSAKVKDHFFIVNYINEKGIKSIAQTKVPMK